MYVMYEGDYYTVEPHKLPEVGDLFRQQGGAIVRASSMSSLSHLVNSGAELLVKLTKSQKISAQAEAMKYFPKYNAPVRQTLKKLVNQQQTM